jgi:hypothetical protein
MVSCLVINSTEVAEVEAPKLIEEWSGRCRFFLKQVDSTYPSISKPDGWLTKQLHAAAAKGSCDPQRL